MGKIVDQSALSSALTKLNEWLTTRKATLDEGMLRRSEIPQLAMPFDGFSDEENPTIKSGEPTSTHGIKIIFYSKKGRFYATDVLNVYASFPGQWEYHGNDSESAFNSNIYPLPGKLFIYKNDIYVAQKGGDGKWSLRPLTAINNLLENCLTEDDLTETLQDYVTDTTLNNKGYITTAALNNALSSYVKSNTISYMTEAEAEALVDDLFQ